MPNRSFTDPDGVVWQAWDVFPGQHTEVPEARNLPGGMGAGWLCFESEREKRRLTPIPARWERRSDEDLWMYCRLARPVNARRTQPS